MRISSLAPLGELERGEAKLINTPHYSYAEIEKEYWDVNDSKALFALQLLRSAALFIGGKYPITRLPTLGAIAIGNRAPVAYRGSSGIITSLILERYSNFLDESQNPVNLVPNRVRH